MADTTTEIDLDSVIERLLEGNVPSQLLVSLFLFQRAFFALDGGVWG
jgi:hypothetical protein